MVGWRSGSAGALQAQGHRFKSCTDHQKRAQAVEHPLDSLFCIWAPTPEAPLKIDSSGRCASRAPAYFFFGAQSRRPGTAPPATSHKYRLATVLYGE